MASAQATWLGVKGNPAIELEWLGVVFKKGEATSVTDAEMIKRLQGNAYFELKDVELSEEEILPKHDLMETRTEDEKAEKEAREKAEKEAKEKAAREGKEAKDPKPGTPGTPPPARPANRPVPPPRT